MNENSPTSVLQQSNGFCETAPHSKLGDGEKTRSTLQTLSPNVRLTRLDVDSELTRNGGSVNVRRVNKKSALHRELLTRRALSASRFPSRRNDGVTATKSRRHDASRSSSTQTKCRCFGRPMVCSICITRSDLCCIHDQMCQCVCKSSLTNFQEISPLCLQCFDCWLGSRKGIRSVKI